MRLRSMLGCESPLLAQGVVSLLLSRFLRWKAESPMVGPVNPDSTHWMPSGFTCGTTQTSVLSSSAVRSALTS